MHLLYRHVDVCSIAQIIVYCSVYIILYRVFGAEINLNIRLNAVSPTLDIVYPIGTLFQGAFCYILGITTSISLVILYALKNIARFGQHININAIVLGVPLKG